MRLKAITCLPGVAAQPEALDLGASRIVHLPFAEWLALEGQSRSAPYNQLDRGYRRNPPLFWETTIDVDASLVVDRKQENTVALSHLIDRELEALVKALHWYSGTAPIHPSHSVTYFDPRSAENSTAFPDLEAIIGEHGVQRRYGESEKEYATQNEHATIHLRRGDAAPFADMLAFARQTQEVWMGEEFQRAAQSLRLCSAPGLGWPARILLLVGAYESLLLPDRRTDLQKGFETRFSAMAASRFEELAQYASWLKWAYRLRSDLIHGRPLGKSLEKLPAPPGEYVRVVGRAGVLALCRLIRYRHANPALEGGLDPLWAALDAAGQHREGFAALQALISGAAPTPVRHQWQVEDEPCR